MVGDGGINRGRAEQHPGQGGGGDGLGVELSSVLYLEVVGSWMTMVCFRLACLVMDIVGSCTN